MSPTELKALQASLQSQAEQNAALLGLVTSAIEAALPPPPVVVPPPAPTPDPTPAPTPDPVPPPVVTPPVVVVPPVVVPDPPPVVTPPLVVIPPVVTPPVETPPVEVPPVVVPKVEIKRVVSYFNHAQVFVAPFPGAGCYLAVEWDEATQTFGHDAKSSGDAQAHAPLGIAYSPDPWHILLPDEELLPGLQGNGIRPEGKTVKIVALDRKVPFSGDIKAGLMDSMAPDADNCPPVVYGQPLCDDIIKACANAHGGLGSPAPVVLGISDPILLRPDRTPSTGKVLFEETFEESPAIVNVPVQEGVTPDAPDGVVWFDAPTFEVIMVRSDRPLTLANPPMIMHDHFHGFGFDSGRFLLKGQDIGGEGASSIIFRPKVSFDLARGRTRFSAHSNCHFLDGRFAYDVYLPEGDILLHNDFFRTDNAGNRPCPGSGGQAIGVLFTNATICVYVWDKGVLVDSFDPVFGKRSDRWLTDPYAAWRCHPTGGGNPSGPGYKDGLNDHNCGMDWSHHFETELTVFGPDTLVSISEERQRRVAYRAPLVFLKPVRWYMAQVLYHSAKETEIVGTGTLRPDGQYGRGQFDANGKLVTAYAEEQFGIRCQRGVNVWHLLHPMVEQFSGATVAA